MWQRGKRSVIQVYRKWKIAPAEEGQSSANEKVETEGNTTLSTKKTDGPLALPSQKSVEVNNNYYAESGDSYISESSWKSDASVKKRPRKTVSSHGCLLCFAVMCPVLLITAAVILKTACHRLKYEYEMRVPATCSLTQVQEVVNQTTWCGCGYCTGRNGHQWACLSSYPCYVINVTYVTTSDVTTGSAILAGVNSSTSCSIDLLQDCYIEPEMNRKLVEEQVVKLQQTSPAVECVHDKENNWNAHLAEDYKTVKLANVVHCYFWPAVLIALALVWMLSVGYDTITAVRARYAYYTWRRMQSPTYITPSGSDFSYTDMAHEPASWIDRLVFFLQDQIKEPTDDTTEKRQKLLEEMRCRNSMLTESGQVFHRPGPLRNPVNAADSSMIIQGILDKDAEGIVKRAKLDEVECDMTTDEVGERTAVMSEGEYSDAEPERQDSVFQTNDVFSVTSLP